MTQGTGTAERKRQARAALSSQRSSMDPGEAQKQNGAIVAHAAAMVRARPPTETRIAAYSPMPGEPGGDLLLTTLRSEATELYLPISGGGGVLYWAEYEGAASQSPGLLGIAEPEGRRHDWRVLQECSVMFVPALGITSTGVRIGKGAGYYDRTLAQLRDAEGLRPVVVALLFKGEITDRIPVEDHDMPVDRVITSDGVSIL